MDMPRALVDTAYFRDNHDEILTERQRLIDVARAETDRAEEQKRKTDFIQKRTAERERRAAEETARQKKLEQERIEEEDRTWNR